MANQPDRLPGRSITPEELGYGYWHVSPSGSSAASLLQMTEEQLAAAREREENPRPLGFRCES